MFGFLKGSNYDSSFLSPFLQIALCLAMTELRVFIILLA